ncbi:MAG: HipA domain-containing protein [Elusimicrobia bacterium]|nr:HipA domain-containing protein [Elusimicrobiota bacterium]
MFKYPQRDTGQHWAEKVAAEIAEMIGIWHAKVELAIFQNEKGSATASFARDGRSLIHGNQLLAGHLQNYEVEKRFQQSSHTLDNIFLVLENIFVPPEFARRMKERFADYIVLDALIGNNDRHHENWGILRKITSATRWEGYLAPSFDHASSLGRELRDEGKRLRCRKNLLKEKKIADYSEMASGIFGRTQTSV